MCAGIHTRWKMFALKSDMLMIRCLNILGHFWTCVSYYQHLLSISYRSYTCSAFPVHPVTRGRVGAGTKSCEGLSNMLKEDLKIPLALFVTKGMWKSIFLSSQRLMHIIFKVLVMWGHIPWVSSEILICISWNA